MFHVKHYPKNAKAQNKKGKIKIMGYKMPLVVKEVYLPIDTNILGGTISTFEDYKKEYGIDLEDVFTSFNEDDNIRVRLKSFTKLYGVLVKSAEPNAAYPLIIDSSVRNQVILFVMLPFGDTESTYTRNRDCGMVINIVNKTVGLYEI